jgi:multiple sugar transport system substrate-binding protein
MDMNVKKGMMLLLAGGAVAGVIALAQGFNEPKYAAAPEGDITLEYWSWVPKMEEQAALFTKKYPNIKVKVVNLGGGQSGTYPKLQTALKAGTGAPDLAQVEFGYIPFFASTGGLADLGKYLPADAKNYFVPWTWSQVSPDGKAVYGMPQDAGPFAMIYRKDLFDQYKVAVPTTWTEYAAAGQKLFTASKGKVKIGNFFSTYAPWFTALVWASGGQMWKANADGSYTQTLNNAASLRVANFWGDLIKKKQVSTLPAFTADFWNAVNNGEVATSMEAAWGTGSFQGSLSGLKNASKNAVYRVAPLPQWTKGGTASGNWGGSTAVVTTQSKNPEAAALFAYWLMTSKDSLVAGWNGAGLFPAAEAGLDLPELADKTRNPSKFYGGQNVAAVYKAASKGVNTTFQWSPWAPTVDSSFSKQMDAAVKGRQTFAAAINNWQKETLDAAKKDGYQVK